MFHACRPFSKFLKKDDPLCLTYEMLNCLRTMCLIFVAKLHFCWLLSIKNDTFNTTVKSVHFDLLNSEPDVQHKNKFNINGGSNLQWICSIVLISCYWNEFLHQCPRMISDSSKEISRTFPEKAYLLHCVKRSSRPQRPEEPRLEGFGALTKTCRIKIVWTSFYNSLWS